MANTWVILDVNNLCHRAFHAMGGLSHNGAPTGAVFGLVRDALAYRDRWQATGIVFCFDDGESLRKQIYPQYKSKRRQDETEEKRIARCELYDQIDCLKYHWLNKVGFRNSFYAPGYEADDVIASVVKGLPPADDAIIVSSDHDLYQLLKRRRRVDCMGNTLIFHPKGETIDWTVFIGKYEVGPAQWPIVKAMAGCPSDNIIGIRGVGEKTAIKHLTGRLLPGVIRKRINESSGIVASNLLLTSLPYEGCPEFEPQPDNVSDREWRKFTEAFGMKSLAGRL